MRGTNLDQKEKWLFWACFISLIATAFGFIVRTQVIDTWGEQFNLTETQKGEIFGVGLWPFAISIVLFSLVVDRVGYSKAMLFAFVCHVSSAIVTITAEGYWGLYIGTFIVALGNGTVEAVINPVVATIFPREKTKWLNILHAGWPGGLVLGGLIGLLLGPAVDWRWKVALIFLPTLVYGVMMIRAQFPIQERVAAGVSYRAMLQEAGILGCVLVVGLILLEVGRVAELSGGRSVADGWRPGARLRPLHPILGPPDVPLLAAGNDPVSNDRVGHGQLDYLPADPGDGAPWPTGWLGPGLHLSHHDGSSLFRRADRSQDLSPGAIGCQQSDCGGWTHCPFQVDRFYGLAGRDPLRLREDVLLANPCWGWYRNSSPRVVH